MGWIFQDLRSQNYTSVEKIYSENYPTMNTNTFFCHIISVSSMTEIFSRQYTKIQDAIAKIGGFVSCLFFIYATVNNSITYPDVVKVFFNSYYNNILDKKNNLSKEYQTINDDKKSVSVNPFKINFRR